MSTTFRYFAVFNRSSANLGLEFLRLGIGPVWAFGEWTEERFEERNRSATNTSGKTYERVTPTYARAGPGSDELSNKPSNLVHPLLSVLFGQPPGLRVFNFLSGGCARIMIC